MLLLCYYYYVSIDAKLKYWEGGALGKPRRRVRFCHGQGRKSTSGESTLVRKAIFYFGC